MSDARLVFERNPVWRQETDPIRRQAWDRAEVVVGSAEPEVISGHLAAGSADLPWGVLLPQEGVPIGGSETGYALDPYLAFNVIGPRADEVLGRRQIRRALAGAIDREGVAELAARVDPGWTAHPAWSIVPTGNDGHHVRERPPVAAPGESGRTLAEAGWTGEHKLIAVCPAVPPYPEITRSCAQDLARIGVSVVVTELPLDEYRELLDDPARAREGAWDLACTSWSPSWCHDNARVFLQPLFQSSDWRGTANCGQYGTPRVDGLINDALNTVDPRESAARWGALEQEPIEDCAIVLLLFRSPKGASRRSSRLRDAIALPASGHAVDLVNVRPADVEA
ncbi:ABC transporter substrate-binding protein [Saccharopolyspora sp. CA-218241]|uniref:ABC transporter substrate-binding protein n=1 Tax=Saccharopolyspora sp. CA-218241 TaxID=3240027 RepID=UPI003D98EA3E